MMSHDVLSCTTELDALQFEEEEEPASYLADLSKAPDFIDEPPLEEHEVRTLTTTMQSVV